MINPEERDVWVVDVAPRDGLQNDPAELTVDDKVELVRRLLAAGVYRVEVGSFVSPKWVPKMADTDEVGKAARACRRPLHLPYSQRTGLRPGGSRRA